MDLTVFSFEEVDRTVYNTIRLLLVAGNHLPDVMSFPATEQGKLDYQAAKDALGDDLIEIFGVGTGNRRGLKDCNRIVINRKNGSPASSGMGGYPATKLVQTVPNPATPADKRWRKEYLPDAALDLHYDIRVISSTTKYERVMSTVLHTAIGLRRYMLAYSPDLSALSGKNFLVFYNTDTEIAADYLNDWAERMYFYTVADIWLDTGLHTISDAIVPLTSIDFRIWFDESKLGTGTPDSIIHVE